MHPIRHLGTAFQLFKLIFKDKNKSTLRSKTDLQIKVNYFDEKRISSGDLYLWWLYRS